MITVDGSYCVISGEIHHIAQSEDKKKYRLFIRETVRERFPVEYEVYLKAELFHQLKFMVNEEVRLMTSLWQVRSEEGFNSNSPFRFMLEGEEGILKRKRHFDLGEVSAEDMFI